MPIEQEQFSKLYDDKKRAHERVVSRALLTGGVVGSFGGMAGAISALWKRNPYVFRNALFTGSTLLVFSSGSTFFAEIYRELKRDGKASLQDSFISGTMWGVVIGRGSLGVRGRGLLTISFYLGCFSAVMDYCMLKLLTPQRLVSSKSEQRPQPTEPRPSRRWWSWLPVIGDRAKRIEELNKEIEELSKSSE